MGDHDWDYWITHVDTISELSPIEKERAKAALKYLKSFLNVDFDSFAQQAHPLAWEIINTAPWTRRYLVTLVNAIQEIRNQKNGSALVDKLRIPAKYKEALFELDVANCFVSAGFSLEIYPIIPETGKKPDIKITNSETNEVLYVELAELGDSEDVRQVNETFDAISEKLLYQRYTKPEDRLECMARIHKYLAKPNLTRILHEIDKAIERAKERGFATIEEDDVIEVGLARTNKMDLLRQWAHARKIDSTLIGPEYHTDEVRRLIKKIEKEQDQLPKGHLNLIVIHTNYLTRFSLGIDMVGKIEEHVYNYEHIAYCVFVRSIIAGDGQNNILSKDDHIHAVIFNDLAMKEVVILANRFAKSKALTLNTSWKIKQAFLKGPIILS